MASQLLQDSTLLTHQRIAASLQPGQQESLQAQGLAREGAGPQQQEEEDVVAALERERFELMPLAMRPARKATWSEVFVSTRRNRRGSGSTATTTPWTSAAGQGRGEREVWGRRSVEEGSGRGDPRLFLHVFLTNHHVFQRTLTPS